MKLTKTQHQVFDKLCKEHLDAHNKTFEEWVCRDDDFADYNDFLEYANKFGKKEAERTIEFYKTLYDEARNQNIYLAHTSSNTLRAMERKGLIEIIRDGGKYMDKVRLLTD